jgi:hypothetical protein
MRRPDFGEAQDRAIMRAYPLVALRRYDEAIRECDIARELEDRIPRAASVGPRVFPTALRGYALAKAGRRAEAEAMLERIRRLERDTYVPPRRAAPRSCCTRWDAMMRRWKRCVGPWRLANRT